MDGGDELYDELRRLRIDLEAAEEHRRLAKTYESQQALEAAKDRHFEFLERHDQQLAQHFRDLRAELIAQGGRDDSRAEELFDRLDKLAKDRKVKAKAWKDTRSPDAFQRAQKADRLYMDVRRNTDKERFEAYEQIQHDLARSFAKEQNQGVDHFQAYLAEQEEYRRTYQAELEQQEREAQIEREQERDDRGYER